MSGNNKKESDYISEKVEIPLDVLSPHSETFGKVVDYLKEEEIIEENQQVMKADFRVEAEEEIICTNIVTRGKYGR